MSSALEAAMRRAFAIVSLSCLLWISSWHYVSAAPTFAAIPPSLDFDGGTPEKSAKAWIRLISSVRPTTVSRPVIFFSPYEMKHVYPRSPIRLSNRQYDWLVRYSQSYRCLGSRGDDLEVVEYSTGQEQRICSMGSSEACKYMNDILRSAQLNLIAADKRFLREWIGYSFDPRAPCHSALPHNIQR